MKKLTVIIAALCCVNLMAAPKALVNLHTDIRNPERKGVQRGTLTVYQEGSRGVIIKVASNGIYAFARIKARDIAPIINKLASGAYKKQKLFWQNKNPDSGSGVALIHLPRNSSQPDRVLVSVTDEKDPAYQRTSLLWTKNLSRFISTLKSALALIKKAQAAEGVPEAEQVRLVTAKPVVKEKRRRSDDIFSTPKSRDLKPVSKKAVSVPAATAATRLLDSWNTTVKEARTGRFSKSPIRIYAVPGGIRITVADLDSTASTVLTPAVAGVCRQKLAAWQFRTHAGAHNGLLFHRTATLSGGGIDFVFFNAIPPKWPDRVEVQVTDDRDFNTRLYAILTASEIARLVQALEACPRTLAKE